MTKRLLAGVFATALLAAISTIPAEAACRDSGACSQSVHKTKTVKKKKAVKSVAVSHRKKVSGKSRRKVASARSVKRKSSGVSARTSSARDSGTVVTLIQSMAPGHGVPAWFALRIAKVESNYNPNARGSAGELGVFQLKCATAKGIGYRGSCSGLLDARTNVHYGLRHLALAMKSSRGNLRLAASKHNGGLGRRTEVAGYVAKVF